MASSVIIELSLLRPTQMTVGFRQIKHKRKRLKELSKRPAELVEFILERPIRVVRGPAERAYVIDHHHLALALMEQKYQTAPMQVDADLSRLTQRQFWAEMQAREFVYPVDAHGKRHAVSELPGCLTDLRDDPFRSLAGFVRMAGGFAKVETPFAEFLWADFFRLHIRKKMLAKDFDAAIEQAVALARQPDAKHLPGYLKVKKT
jgi:hypothetical protein